VEGDEGIGLYSIEVETKSGGRMEEVTLRVKIPSKVSEETKREIEKELELEAIRLYLELKSRKKERKKLPVEKYMGVFGRASAEELDAYALEAEEL
jgi:hypothetical protein